MKRCLKLFLGLFSLCILVVMGLIGYADLKIEDKYYVESFDNLSVSASLPINYSFKEVSQNVDYSTNSGNKKDVVFKLFGIFPINTANVTLRERKTVDLMGTPFGIKLYTDGVLVVELTDFETNNGKCCPAEEAGLKMGDYITKIGDTKITSNKQIERIVDKCEGKALKVYYCRDSIDYETNIIPILSEEDNKYHIGVWVKDSSAGIGTLTFYDRENNVLAGLGHGLCDGETGRLISVNTGAIVEAEILSATKGEKHKTGELNGRFINNYISTNLLNSNTGIYAEYSGEINPFKTIEAAFKQEIIEGYAQVLITTNGTNPQLYDCEITKINSYNTQTKNFVISITDGELLSLTGGIVQGMSGSPILQNGKLIGAVTHVLVDDPTKGYAIFAENMLETAKSVAESNKLKDAS